MYVVEPTKLSKFDEDRLMSGYLQNRLSILEHALENAKRDVDPETIREAATCVSETVGIPITAAEFAKVLQLYPYAVAKFADYGWGDTEIREMAHDVVANAFLGTRWPMGVDGDCDMLAFVENLQFAYAKAKPLLNA